MNFLLPDELSDLQDRLLAFVAEQIDPITRGADPESPSRELHGELRREIARLSEAAGFYRLSVPVGDGGPGGGRADADGGAGGAGLLGQPVRRADPGARRGDHAARRQRRAARGALRAGARGSAQRGLRLHGGPRRAAHAGRPVHAGGRRAGLRGDRAEGLRDRRRHGRLDCGRRQRAAQHARGRGGRRDGAAGRGPRCAGRRAGGGRRVDRRGHALPVQLQRDAGARVAAAGPDRRRAAQSAGEHRPDAAERRGLGGRLFALGEPRDAEADRGPAPLRHGAGGARAGAGDLRRQRDRDVRRPRHALRRRASAGARRAECEHRGRDRQVDRDRDARAASWTARSSCTGRRRCFAGMRWSVCCGSPARCGSPKGRPSCCVS